MAGRGWAKTERERGGRVGARGGPAVCAPNKGEGEKLLPGTLRTLASHQQAHVGQSVADLLAGVEGALRGEDVRHALSNLAHHEHHEQGKSAGEGERRE